MQKEFEAEEAEEELGGGAEALQTLLQEARAATTFRPQARNNDEDDANATEVQVLRHASEGHARGEKKINAMRATHGVVFGPTPLEGFFLEDHVHRKRVRALAYSQWSEARARLR